ncbi:MAG TPA: FG-GAP-like repeat-containing protein [Sandaracinaceae bacterium LLY-WYZ-13_1]|nr:FG-GAP-like repeat-containing protein [Sandaracinaceae bacterium LLY-WYZ-13_1]
MSRSLSRTLLALALSGLGVACDPAPTGGCEGDGDCPTGQVCSAAGRCASPPGDAGPSPADTGPARRDAGGRDAGGEDPPPPRPVPRWPANGASTGSVHGSPVLPEAALRPRFAWDPVTEASRYEIQITSECTTPGFADCAFEAPAVEAEVTEPSHRPSLLDVSASPPVGRRYYWRVRACRGGACSSWSTVRYLDVGRLPNDFDGDGYGDLLAGAHTDDGALSNQGRAYWWNGSSTGPRTPPNQLAPPTAEENGNFGISTASVGDVNADGFADAVIGAHRIDTTAEDTGAVYLYLGSATGLPTAPSTTIPAPTTDSGGNFGRSVGVGGDVDGDGFADVLVSAHGEEAGGSNRGRAYVFHGGADGVDPTPATVLNAPGSQDGEQFGFPITGVGDVDGDGFADVLVPSRNWDGDQTDQGRVFLFAGSALGVVDVAARTFDDPIPTMDAELGWGNAPVGDVNGDHFMDVVFGGRRRGGFGGVLAFYGSASGPGTTPDLDVLQPDMQASAGYGFSVTGARDVNGDGLSDVVIGARLFDRSESNEGRAYVHYGAPDGLPAVADVVLNGNPREAGAQFGYSAASAGDVNGDGYADVVIGAYNQDTAATNAGGLFLFLGTSDGLSRSGTLLASPRGTDGRLGVSSAAIPAW